MLGAVVLDAVGAEGFSVKVIDVGSMKIVDCSRPSVSVNVAVGRMLVTGSGAEVVGSGATLLVGSLITDV